MPTVGMNLFNGEELHRHHIDATGRGWNGRDENRGLVHLYCHQQIHRTRGTGVPDQKQTACCM